jgi:hypothetical protein
VIEPVAWTAADGSLQSKSWHHPRRRYRSAANQDTPEIEGQLPARRDRPTRAEASELHLDFVADATTLGRIAAALTLAAQDSGNRRTRAVGGTAAKARVPREILVDTISTSVSAVSRGNEYPAWTHVTGLGLGSHDFA